MVRVFAAQAQDEAVYTGPKPRVVSRADTAGYLVRERDELVARYLRRSTTMVRARACQSACMRAGGGGLPSLCVAKSQGTSLIDGSARQHKTWKAGGR